MSTINLLPHTYVVRRRRRRENALCLVMFVLVMTGVVGAILVSGQSFSQTRGLRDEIGARYLQAAQQIDQIQKLKAQKAALLARADQACGLMERVPRSYLLALITGACPPNTTLLSIRLQRSCDAGAMKFQNQSKFSAVQQKQGGGTEVEIILTGLAGTDVEVARLIAGLSRSPLLAGVDLVYSEQRLYQKQMVREFQVKLDLRPNVDVLDAIEHEAVTDSLGKKAASRGTGIGPLFSGVVTGPMPVNVPSGPLFQLAAKGAAS